MEVKTLMPYLLIYTVGAVCTFGLFYRDQKQVPVGPKQFVAAIAWPLWWMIAKGFVGILDAIDNLGSRLN
ncbi:hypothetical protein [Bradyrhizobium elkanii]|uniref:hypothetical protein n=1 Tax=Bradyrhizobium elkanii TaxID=29448 RepID=UPI0027144EE3|nr:hypothetical protein [Bradyrhizobium elkanii]WLB79006.1 hypothetical protein QIH83_32440 [Bradyrhizobium elkanii]